MSDTGTIAILSTVGVIGVVTLLGIASGVMEGKKKHNEKAETSVGGSRHTRRKHRRRRNGTRRA
jgi:hypothetical protein